MDRFGPRLTALIGAVAAATAAAMPLPADLPLRDARWINPPQRLATLTSRPLECAAIPHDPDGRRLFEIGRAAFRAPLLLGGQAARAGLRCESCHSNGRRNPAFRFPGLSGDPGTADVTSSLMSSHRGDATFDPRPIPDLGLPGKVSRAVGDPALERFIHGLIVEEFDGAEPPPSVLAGLGAYVRAVGQGSCGRGGREAVTLDGAAGDVARALAAARFATDAGDSPAARLLVSAARSALGLLDERFAVPALARDRAQIRQADRDLLAIEKGIDAGQPGLAASISAAQTRLVSHLAPLRRDASRSLLNPDNLRAALRR